MKNSILLLLLFTISCNKSEVSSPSPVLPVPNKYQLEWQEKELFAFIHFTINTFTGMEWGFGDEDPNLFNPVDFNPDQWAEVLKEAGFKGAILTAKHHDGFCLWPSKYTEHSVKNIKWKEGKGDIVGEFREACIKHGLEFGIYLSPWDRNHAAYASPAYVKYYQNQLEELLENYGPIFEIWFDGANGGTGYYGGANERRTIDDQVYYNWDGIFKLLRNFDPGIFIRGDARSSAISDGRWCGNERGFVGETNWNMVTPDTVRALGKERIKMLNTGSESGEFWMPAEVDVSIRPGWFYHAFEDSLVKSPEELFEIYLHSIGRGSPLLLNVAPDKRGLIPEQDIQSLSQWKKKIDQSFSDCLATNANISVDSYRGKSKKYASSNLNDGKKETYWATDDNITSGTILCEFETPQEVQFVVIQEFIPLGQRVRSFNVEVLNNGEWIQVANATTIGYKRIINIDPVETRQLRVNITGARACLAISNIEVY